MLFTTIDFVIFFIVILGIIVTIKNRRFQHLFLLAASYFFFYYTSNYLILLLIFSTILDFYIGKHIWKTNDLLHNKILLISSLAVNLGLLGFYKYVDFAILQFNIFGNYFNLTNDISFLNLVLPIGISFYTFQTISYTVDIYRGQLTPSKSFWEFALFVSFFPQLVAGPILRARQFLPQLREKINTANVGRIRQIVINNSNLKFGITLMALGFFKKMFIADNLAPFVNTIFQDPIGLESFTIIMGTIAFAIQIYCDFSGYTDIAIGAAIILGFKIPINFNKPYFATSPSDFWKRWHISLSSWLRDYLYIPLGGNRNSSSRTYANLIIVMFLGGLWHGASWNFVIWGLLHGIYLAIHRAILNRFPKLKIHPFFKSTPGKILCILTTQYFVLLAWIPFRVSDFDAMVYSIQKFVFIDFQTENTLDFLLTNHKSTIMIMILFVILHFISYKKGNLVESITNVRLLYWSIFLAIIMLSIFFFYIGDTNDFIYFQF